MTLAQIIDSVMRRSYRSRTREDVIEAINSAARRVYMWVVKETPGKYFLKWDTTITLTPGTAEYELPADIAQLVRIREFDAATGKWRIIHSTDFNDLARMQNEFPTFYGYDDTVSPYRFYGPYEKGDGKYYIQVQPDFDQNRNVELVYAARYVEIESESDYFMIPEDGRDVVKDFALAECLEHNDDMQSQVIRQRAGEKLTEYLTLERSRQIQDTPKQVSYL